MKPFIHGGRQVEVRTVTGVVVGTHKHAETYVSGGGGGGAAGNTSPVSISSTVVIKLDFFIKRDDNQQEEAIQLRGVDIPLRDGQKVTMISGEVKGQSEHWMRLVNHNANQVFWRTWDAPSAVKEWKLVRPTWLRLLVGWTIFGSFFFLRPSLVNFAFSVFPQPSAGSPPLTMDKIVDVMLRFDGLWVHLMLNDPDRWIVVLFTLAYFTPVLTFVAAVVYWVIEAIIRKRVAKLLGAHFDELARAELAGTKR